MMRKYLRVIAALCLTFLVALPGEAGNRKGDRFFKQAQAAEIRKDWDLALQLYKQAVDEDPRDSGYLIGMQRSRFQASSMHVDRGQKSRADGNLQDAISEFQKAIVADPSSAIALQELKRTQDMLQAPSATVGGRVLTPVEQIRREANQQVDSMLGPPELKPALRRIPSIKLNNQPPRVLYESIGKIAGITTVIDPDGLGAVQTRNFNVEMGEATVDQAFDYVALLTHTYWKPISPTTIFVTQDSANKRRDYEDFVVKTFYITNASTVQEFQEISTAVRTITNITRVFTVNPQKALVVRGSADAVALAEKLVHDLDKPKSEVVIDVLIMEANTTHTRDLAASLASVGASGLSSGLSSAINFTPRGSTTTGGGTDTSGNPIPASTSGSITLGRLGHISSNDFSTTLPGVLLQAVLSDNKTKILNSPQVRASDGMKVSLKIGDRIPIATGSFQSGVGTVGGAPYAQTQFQFTDVGIKVEITPQVHSNDEVTLHVSFEVSSVRSYTNIGGVQQPIIGQTTTEADIRLREGEINILAGLDGVQDSSVVNGIPGLVNIPILGKILFGSDHTEKDSQQLMIALQPHIVRTPDYTPENLRGVYSGPDQSLRLMYAPRDDEGSAPAAPAPGAPAPNPGAGLAPAAIPGLGAGPAIGPALVPGQAVATGPAPGTVPLPLQLPVPGGPGTPPPPVPLPLGAGPRVVFNPGSISVGPNTPFTVNVELNGAADAASVSPLRVKWDPAVLRLTDIAPGDLFSRNGGAVTSIKDVRNDAGEATINLTRTAGAGITGSGPVAVLNFVAVAPGKGSVTVTEMGLKNSQAQTMPVALGSVSVAVQ